MSDSFRPPVKQNPTLDCFHLCVLPIQVCVVNQLSGAGSSTVLRSREGDEVDVGWLGVGGGVVTHPTCNSACRVERTERRVTCRCGRKNAAACRQT